MPKDYYNLLGIQRTASQDEIKKAYRKLAHQYHPDKKGGDEAKFKEINEAYQVLSDPKKRSNYDNFGFAYNDGGFQGGYDFNQGANFWDFFNQGTGRRSQGGFEDIFDMFSEAFGGFRQAGQYDESTKGEDVYLEFNVGRKDLGTNKIVEFEILGTCDECEGVGAAKGHKIIECKTCKGTGQIRHSSKSGFAFVTRVSVCNTCKGKGRYPEKECPKCHAQGRMKVKRKIEVRLPSQLEDIYNVIIPKGGNVGKNGLPPGDLIVSIRVK